MSGVYFFDERQELIVAIPNEEIYENQSDENLRGLIKHYVTTKDRKDLDDAKYFGMHDVDDPNTFLMFAIHQVDHEWKRRIFEGVHIFFEDLKGDVVRDVRPQNRTAVGVLPAILEGTGWTLGTASVTKVSSGNFYYISKLDAFWEAVEQWDFDFRLEMTFSKGKILSKRVHIADKMAPEYGKWYELGDQLLSVVAEESRANVYTAFIGRGKGEETESGGYGRKILFTDVAWSTSAGDPADKPKGQDFIEVPWATAQYGYPDGRPKITVLDFPDITDRDELLQLTWEQAQELCRPKVQLKSSVAPREKAELGEVVRIIADEQHIRYETRIFRIQRDFKNLKRREFEFGDKIASTQAERFRAQTKEVKKVANDLEYDISLKLKQLGDAIVESYFNEDGWNYEMHNGNEYNLPGGYYSFDKPIDQNPTKVIYIGAGKIMIANKKTSTGAWDWSTFGTGDGFTADLITAGTIDGNVINVTNLTATEIIAGILQDKLGYNQWNFNTGYLNVGNGAIVYNPTTKQLTIKGSAYIEAAAIPNLSASKLDGGEINAQTIRIKNQDLSEFVRGFLNTPTFDTGFGSSQTHLKGPSVALGTNSQYITLRDTGGRGEFLVQGTSGAHGSGYSYEMNAGGVAGGTSRANTTRMISAGTNGVVIADQIGSTVLRFYNGAMYYQGKKIVLNTDNSGIHYE